MKRKFKLFATVASLCLSVALMAFGVYAASTVTYTVNGTVSYEMNDVLVNIKTVLSYAENTHKGYASVSAAQTAADEVETWLNYAAETDPDGEGTLTAITDGVIGNYTSYDTNEVATVSGLSDDQTSAADVNFNTSSLWRIQITITTINPTGVTVAFTSSAEEGKDKYGITTTNPNYAIAEPTSQSESNKLAEDTGRDGSVKLTLTYYVYLIDPTVEIDPSAPFTIKLSITQTAAQG